MLEATRADALVVISTSYVDEAAACDTLAYLDRGRVVASVAPRRYGPRPRSSCTRVGDDPRAIAHAARRLGFVAAPCRRSLRRVEVRRDRTPGAAAVLRALSGLQGAQVRFSEQRPADMESTLLALATAV